ncbi:HTH-type transcriptional regulator LutR [mine drainage metagenome]|uniref:HTH-type transcriptional regulator LutR n=1 Tax=mine drainage metagenome TaxID=410659 RepID=A0A1J5QSQ5_9ZZZZ
MARQSLVAMVADDLLDRIVAGEFPPDSTLPGELELAAHHDVSRMTVREAMKTLAAQHVIRVERGRGTFVNPLARWTSMEAVLRAASDGVNAAAASVQLIELRRMLETGAAELAATRISPTELEALGACLEEMRAAHAADDVDRFVTADLAFHDLVLRASGNAFVVLMVEPLSRVLAASRAQTSRVTEIQGHAIDEHTRVHAALTSGDPERSRLAMDHHMTQTLDDLRTYVLDA